MKKLFFLFSIFAIILSCSSDETSTPVTPPPAPIVKYTITLSAGEGGIVSTTGGEYEAGQTVNVTATPQGEYLFKDWSDGNTDATRTITISSNSALTANFEKKKYPLTVNIEGEGQVLEEIVNSGRTTDYNSGTTVKLTAVSSEGWEFVAWTGAIESEELEVQLLVSEAKEINAEFSFICLTNEIENYLLPSYETFKIHHPKDITQVNANVYDYLHKYGTEKISLDYNKDGFMDFVAFKNDYDIEDNRDLIKFYLGDCEGNLTLDELNSNKFEGLVHGRKILLGDYNNDTYPDIFLIGHGWDKPPYPGEYPVILFSSESGIFTEDRLTEFSGFFHGGASGDYDNDGDLDVLMTTMSQYKSYGFIFLENDGNGNFYENENLGPFKENRFNQNFVNCEMYDINKDGFLDLLFMSDREDIVKWNFLPYEVDYSSVILYGNGNDFTGEKSILPKVQGWPKVYDAEFYDLDGNGSEEIIFNRVSNTFDGWYIQILEKDGTEYIDNTEKFIDINSSETDFWNVWLEIRDYDNDGVIEMRNNIPKALKNDARFKLQEWELINGKLIKVN